MKLCVALLLLVAVPAALASFSPEIETVLWNNEEECSKASGLDSAEVEAIRKKREVPDNETANKWAKCMLQTYNVIKSDDTVNMDVKTVNIPADTDTVIRAFPTCSVLTGRDINDTARLMFNCYRSNSEGLLMAYRRKRT